MYTIYNSSGKKVLSTSNKLVAEVIQKLVDLNIDENKIAGHSLMIKFIYDSTKDDMNKIFDWVVNNFNQIEKESIMDVLNRYNNVK